MKQVITPAVTFSPAQRTLDLSAVANFSVSRLYAVINVTSNTFIYAATVPGFGIASRTGAVLTFAADTTAMHANDDLLIIYDDPSPAISLSQGGQPLSPTNRLPIEIDADSVTLSLPAGLAQDASLTALHGDLGLVAKDATVAKDSSLATLHSDLGSILTAIQAQRVESVWTDDTGAFFIRIIKLGVQSWTDPTGNTSVGPGTGARPAAGTSAIVDSTRYQAVAAGTGFSVNDYLSHIVTTDPSTGVVIGHFWLNVSTETKLSAAPSSAAVSPIAALPAGAATDAAVAAIGLVAGAKNDAPAADDTSSASIVALLRRGLVRWTSLLSVLPTSLGIKLAAASFPVALASDTALALKSSPPRAAVTGSLNGANAALVLAVDGMSSIGFKLTGTWVGTIALLGSIDDGANFDIPLLAKPLGGTGGPSVGSFTANGAWDRAVAPLTHVQIKMTAYTSGAAAVYLMATTGGKFARVDTPTSDPLTTTIVAPASGNAYTVPVFVSPPSTATPLTPGTPVSPGRKLFINCTAAGNVRVKLSSGSTFDCPVQVGATELDNYAVVDVVAASTTATATFWVIS